VSITAPLGFRAAGVAAGIKPDRLDLALVAADAPCTAAGVFTSNLAQAAPVLVSREHLAGARARAIVANAGCANAATGEAGLGDAREMAAVTAGALGCPAEEVVVASTGVIGVRLPMDKLRAGIPAAHAALTREGGADAARAIMTTDTRPKEARREFAGGLFKTCRIGGMAKGAGMIAPNMATMLAFFTTDAAVEPKLLARALRMAVHSSFNRITVDGDTSTNDCAILLASGASGAPAIASEDAVYGSFEMALLEVAQELADMLVRDGEGVTRVAHVFVDGARTLADADRIARTVGESSLVKTALHGGDPNWGRVLAAIGRAGVALDISGVSIRIGQVLVARGGAAVEYSERDAAEAMQQDTVQLTISLAEGHASGSVWTSDLSHEYVDINAHYRS
jgi:glutamate N-acetyltransferase / amino-acid N-acetyltransferase